MAVYPAHKSVLVIEPIGFNREDFEYFSNEDSFEILSYFISNNENPAKYKANIYEDFVANYNLSDRDLNEDGVVCCIDPDENKLIFLHLLQNTAWAAKEFGASNHTVLKYLDKGYINGIRTASGKYALVIPDKKFYDFFSQKQARLNMSPAQDQNHKKLGIKAHKKILTVIKSGVLGGFGQPITVEDVLPHMPGMSRVKINTALGTLLKHGDLVRVHLVDPNGTPTRSFSPGKYRINVVPSVAQTATHQPITNLQSSPQPIQDSLYLSLAYAGSKKSDTRVALEKFLNENMVNDHILFTSKQIKRSAKNLTARDIVDTMKVVKRLKKHVKVISPGVWEYRNRTDIPWYNEEQRAAAIINAGPILHDRLLKSYSRVSSDQEIAKKVSKETSNEPSTIGDIAKDLRGAGFSESSIVEIMKTVIAEKIKNF